MGRSTENIGSVLYRMNRKTDSGPKRIHVVRYQHDDDGGGRCYPRAVYALGDKRNCARPAPKTPSQYTQDYRDRNKLRLNSVFAMRGVIHICCSDRP